MGMESVDCIWISAWPELQNRAVIFVCVWGGGDPPPVDVTYRREPSSAASPVLTVTVLYRLRAASTRNQSLSGLCRGRIFL